MIGQLAGERELGELGEIGPYGGREEQPVAAAMDIAPAAATVDAGRGAATHGFDQGAVHSHAKKRLVVVSSVEDNVVAGCRGLGGRGARTA